MQRNGELGLLEEALLARVDLIPYLYHRLCGVCGCGMYSGSQSVGSDDCELAWRSVESGRPDLRKNNAASGPLITLSRVAAWKNCVKGSAELP